MIFFFKTFSVFALDMANACTMALIDFPLFPYLQNGLIIFHRQLSGLLDGLALVKTARPPYMLHMQLRRTPKVPFLFSIQEVTRRQKANKWL